MAFEGDAHVEWFEGNFKIMKIRKKIARCSRTQKDKTKNLLDKIMEVLKRIWAGIPVLILIWNN